MKLKKVSRIMEEPVKELGEGSSTLLIERARFLRSVSSAEEVKNPEIK